MQRKISIQTDKKEDLYDITELVQKTLAESGIQQGLLSLYVQGATAALMIQENWDRSVQQDVINMLAQIAPQGVWLHDQQDGNGAAHLKAGLIGPSETIPVIQGKLGLSRWQNIFLCEFDGPRTSREIICSIIKV